ncbi:MAG: hypothetical protein C3F02_00285 [Parcubacteria group bacterium]|nr:MAG: hypothetical protein C3F02_00285 [Parcubacteria group bacterium]
MIMAENKAYKVLIPAASVSSQLGELVQYTNHALIRVGKKPTLSHIIEAYAPDVPIVILIGHFGEQVRDFVKLAYPERPVTFVEVDNYDGPGSSLGYSMLQAKDFLQCPFIYHAGDTIVEDKIAEPLGNWVACFQSSDTSDYASINVVGDRVMHIDNKGATNYGYTHNLHIGLVGIKQYDIFWQSLESLYQANKLDPTLGDMAVINDMISSRQSFFKSLPVTSWFDVGHLRGIDQARQKIKDPLHILDKINESIFIFRDFVIKFFYDKKNIDDRVARAKILSGLVPRVSGAVGNFYRYEFVEGDLYSRVVSPHDFLHFLEWAETNLWTKPKETTELGGRDFKDICHDFYYTKTVERTDKLRSLAGLKDQEDIINEEKIPSLGKMLEMIDFKWLCDSQPSNFHGDFILDNILKTKHGYCLLDWRQNFGGLLAAGDKYYDLAKLNHNLTVNHDIVNQNLFSIEKRDDGHVHVDILRKDNLVHCQETLYSFLSRGQYDIRKVRVLTALIWLNMSPLHHEPFNLFLYYFGKLHLWRNLQREN